MSGISSEAAWILRGMARSDGVFSVKAAITAVHKRISEFLPSIKASRVEDIWREQAKTIRAEEMDAIRKAAVKAKIDEAKHEYSGVMQDIKRLQALVDILADKAGVDASTLLAESGIDHSPVG